jgi:hypothetical protein
LAYKPADFMTLRGYDTEDTMPASSEDVDLRERLLKYAQVHAPHCSVHRPTQRPQLHGSTVCGCALPNDCSNNTKKHDRNAAKVKNVDPKCLEALGVSPEKAFNKMCNIAWSAVYRRRQEEGRVIRNDRGVCANEQWYCCWWTCLLRPTLRPAPGLEGSSLSSSASAAAEPADRNTAAVSSPADVQPPSIPAAPQGKVLTVNVMWAGMKYLTKVVRSAETRRIRSNVQCQWHVLLALSHSLQSHDAILVEICP